MLRMAKTLGYFCDVVFLEEADGGDASGAGLQAGVSVRQSDSAQS